MAEADNELALMRDAKRALVDRNDSRGDFKTPPLIPLIRVNPMDEVARARKKLRCDFFHLSVRSGTDKSISSNLNWLSHSNICSQYRLAPIHWPPTVELRDRRCTISNEKSNYLRCAPRNAA